MIRVSLGKECVFLTWLADGKTTFGATTHRAFGQILYRKTLFGKNIGTIFYSNVREDVYHNVVNIVQDKSVLG